MEAISSWVFRRAKMFDLRTGRRCRPPMPAVDDCTKRIASEALIRKTRFSVARALRNMRPILRGGLVRPPSEQYLARALNVPG